MRAADDTPADLLDAWLAEPAVRTHHRRTAPAPAPALWHAATTLPLSETRTLGRLVRWRIPGLARDLTYGELFRAYPFTVLDEGAEHLVAGLCGRIWTLARDYPRLAGPTISPAGTSRAPCACCSGTGSSRSTAARRWSQRPACSRPTGPPRYA